MASKQRGKGVKRGAACSQKGAVTPCRSVSAPERMGMTMRATELAASRSASASPLSSAGAALTRGVRVRG